MARARTLAPLLLAAAGLAYLAGALRERAHADFRSAQRYEDVYYLPPRAWLPVFSLGYDAALADLIWMRALVYYGDELSHGGHVQFVFDYAEAIETLDPSFRALYTWVATAGLYRPDEVTEEEIERTLAMMEHGAARFPADGELAWDLAATLMFELSPRIQDPERKQQVRERALPYMLRASRLGAAPAWAGLMSAQLFDQIGQTEQAASQLEEVALTTRDPVTRARLERRIEQLRAQVEADAFVAAMREQESARREEFPYLPLGLYLLVGPRDAVDLDAPIAEGLPRALAAPGPR